MKRIAALGLFTLSFCLALLAQDAKTQLDQIQKLIDAGNWTAAVAAADDLIKAAPKNAGAWVKRGSALHGAGRYQDALDSYEQAEKAGANPVALAFRKAVAYAKLGQNDKAVECLQQAAQNGVLLGSRLQDTDLGSLRNDPRFAAVVAQDERNQHPCSDSGHRQFDFWVGEWDVRTLDGTHVGDSRIERILNDCVILENWTSGRGLAGEGKSFNSFNASTGKWTQFWVDGQGMTTEYVEGEFKDNALRFWGHNPSTDGKPALQRFTFFDLGPEKVRQFQEQSLDDGKTWTVVYDFYYYRKKGS